MRHRELDRLISLAFADGLVGTNFIKPLAFYPPPTIVELENCGRMAIGVVKLEGTRIEVHANQSEQPASLPVAGPENFVVPLGRLPSLSEAWVGLRKNRDKPSFEPLTMLAKEKPGVIDMHIFDDLA